MTTTEQILDEAGGILADPSAWSQGSYCESSTVPHGHTFLAELEQANSYCALGAIREAYRRHGLWAAAQTDVTSAAQALRDTLENTLPPRDFGVHVDIWNDDPGRLHSEVVEMFEKARAFAAEKGM